MQINRSMLALVLAAGVVGVAHANPVGVVKESGRTAGNAVRDGVLTFGRTTRDFFTHGPRTAKRTWNANSATTKANARRHKERVRTEADE
jgi:hypothetical protein